MTKLTHPTTDEPLEAVRLDGRRIGAAELAAAGGVVLAARSLVDYLEGVVETSGPDAILSARNGYLLSLRAAVAALRAVEAGDGK